MKGAVTCSYQFKTWFCSLGDILNEFQQIIDRLTEKLPKLHCYLEDILVATVGSVDDHCKISNNKGLAITRKKLKL